MPDEQRIETVNQTEETSSDSSKANDGDQRSAAETHDEMLGDPLQEAGLISTTEFIRHKDADDTSGDGKSGDASQDGDGDGDEGSDGAGSETDKIDATFQKSPRFQELITQKNEARLEAQRAKDQVDVLSKQVDTLTELVKGLGGTKTNATQELGYRDILQLSDEQIIEGFESDPKGFLANFARQITAEVTAALNNQSRRQNIEHSRAAKEQAINNLYADYEAKNPDFVEAWEKGEVQKFLETNPGNTPISAWEIMKARATQENLTKSREKEIQEAVEKAVKEQTKKFQVKQSSRTISGGPGGGSQRVTKTVPADLANTKEHGGLYTVLANRSIEREKAR